MASGIHSVSNFPNKLLITLVIHLSVPHEHTPSQISVCSSAFYISGWNTLICCLLTVQGAEFHRITGCHSQGPAGGLGS